MDGQTLNSKSMTDNFYDFGSPKNALADAIFTEKYFSYVLTYYCDNYLPKC